MKIIFAHPTHEYDSYRYFRQLARLSGFAACQVEEMDLRRDDVVYITSPANRALSDFLGSHERRSVRAKVIYWNLERPDVHAEPVWDLPTTAVHAATDTVLTLPGVVAAWVSDAYQATLDRFHEHVVLGGHPGIRIGDFQDPSWDLCHFSYVYGRREVIRTLKGFRIASECAEGDAREKILCSSRAILSVHQTPAPVLEALRSAWSAAYKLPFICERVENPFPLEEGVTMATFGHETIQQDLDAIFAMEKSDGFLREMGERRFDLLCKLSNFRDSVESGLRRTLR